MDKIQFMEHKGKRILYLDFSGGAEMAQKTIQQAGSVIQKEPKKSVLTLIDVKEAVWNADAVKALKELAKNDEPYVIASAVVGVTGLKKVLLSAVKRFTGREFVLFDDIEPAMEWLAVQ